MDPRWKNLSDPIFHCAETRRGAPALIEGPERLSYRALAALIAKATDYLHELGIGPGQRHSRARASSAVPA
jgi:non-ribosomal peptide synthetase component E (peptide arylation enzyme)